MRELDVLKDYPSTRRSTAGRVFASKLIAINRNREFFDGERVNGYGGFVNDGRWAAVAKRMYVEYDLGVPDSMQGLQAPGSVLQIQAEKGFLLSEFGKLGVYARGTETSEYARQHSEVPLVKALPTELPFGDKEFDLVLALGPVYTLALGDAVKCLREIQRVGKRAFITLGAYEQEKDYWLMRSWSLLGTTILLKVHWLQVLEEAGYTGDYKFVTAESLGLEWTWG